jgi:biopolymer transport protein ExbD
MEINLPPDKEVKVEIAESNLLTMRVNDKGEMFWNTGIEAPKRLDPATLRAFLRERVQTNPKLVVLLKIERTAKYNRMVNLIDDFSVCRVERFSLAPLLENDKALMAKAGS